MEITIKDPSKLEKPTFSQLAVGALFVFEDRVYVKVSPTNHASNTRMLGKPGTYTFDTQEIHRVKSIDVTLET